MKKHIPIFILLSISFIIKSNTFYVSKNGNNLNNGLSESSSWATLKYAVSNNSPIQPGDIIYVKSGLYKNENVVFEKSGIQGKKISILGYKYRPGDQPEMLSYKENFYEKYNEKEMPTYSGVSRSIGTGFDLTNANYIDIKNIQITNYSTGLFSGSKTISKGVNIDNVNVAEIGDSTKSYNGQGIKFGDMSVFFANNNSISNCTAVNCCAEGITLCGDFNVMYNCKTFCNENINKNISTDYYITIVGSYNTIDKCYAERKPGIYAKGHGISVKNNSEMAIDKGLNYPLINPRFNKISNCIVKNMGESFCVRHRGVEYNYFYHCEATGTHDGLSESQGEGTCIVTRDGASNNIFDGCIAKNCSYGIVFEDSKEDGDTGMNPTGHPGNNNKYINCIINSCYVGIGFSNNGNVQSDAGNNIVANTSFYKTRYMFYCQRGNKNMKYKNCIFYGNSQTSAGGYFSGNIYASDVKPDKFSYCDFFNIKSMPTGFVSKTIEGISLDPQYKNPDNGDFHLLNTSPCINASQSIDGILDDSSCNLFKTITNENSNYQTQQQNEYTCSLKDYDGNQKQTYYGEPTELGAFEFIK